MSAREVLSQDCNENSSVVRLIMPIIFQGAVNWYLRRIIPLAESQHATWDADQCIGYPNLNCLSGVKGSQYLAGSIDRNVIYNRKSVLPLQEWEIATVSPIDLLGVPGSTSVLIFSVSADFVLPRECCSSRLFPLLELVLHFVSVLHPLVPCLLNL